MNATHGSNVNDTFGSFCLYTVNMWKFGVVQTESSMGLFQKKPMEFPWVLMKHVEIQGVN